MKKIKEKKVDIECLGISMLYSEDGGMVMNYRKVDACEDDRPTPEYYAAIFALEAMVMSHESLGVDISQPAYLEGIKRSHKAITAFLTVNETREHP